MTSGSDSYGGKLRTLEDLSAEVDRLKAEGKRVIFTNGCFDILHAGHVRYLREAKALGDFLIVAVNGDASAKKLKGDGRPFTTESERLEILSCLEPINRLILFEDDNVSNILLSLRPHVHAKGTDYTVDSVPERETVKNYGGEVVICGDPKDHSSTDIGSRGGTIQPK